MEILPQLLLNSIIAGAIYSLVALGFNLIFSTAKFFDLGYGAIAAVGGYTVFWFYRELGWDLYLSIALGVALAAVLGLIIEKLVYRPLRRRKAGGMVLIVASLGVMTALQAVVAILFTSQFQTLATSGAARVFQVGGGVITGIQLAILVTGLVVMVLLAAWLKFTRFGKAVRAVGDDEEVAAMVGINTEKVTGIVFLVGSAIAGLAGILVGFDTGIEPTMGLPLLLKGVIAAIIGGVGNVYGGVLGAFFLGLVENFGIWQISGEWKDAIAFGLLIIFLLVRPKGILPK